MEIAAPYALWPSLVGGVLGYLLGVLWYGPILGAAWRKASELTVFAPSAGPMILALLSWIVMGLVFGGLVAIAGASSLAACLWLAVLAWLGFSAAPYAMNLAFQGRKPSLFLIDTGYVLAGFLLFAVIHAVWD